MKANKFKIFNIRQLLLILIDLCCLMFSYLVCMLLNPSIITYMSIGYLALNYLFFAVAIFIARLCLGIYNNVWRYATFGIYLRTVLADIFGGGIALLLCIFSGLSIGPWHSVAIVALSSLTSLSLRFAYQFIHQKIHSSKKTACNYVAIVGAGNLGMMLARELLYNVNSKYRPLCFIDIDKRKIGSKILDIVVLDGNDKKLLDNLKKLPLTDVILAFSDSERSRIENLYKFYSQTGLNIKIYDYPFSEGKRGNGEKRVLREIRIEDLLFRDPIRMENQKQMEEYYSGKTVLVTGGGGSIGSELCRQIAQKSPKKLIILDIYENNAYEIQQELLMKYGKELSLSVEIASVRDRERLSQIFEHYRPDIVFHAAAHKHVPLMEHSPREAIKNNVFGTYNTADMAEKYEAEKFILISTDKAVNPTNIMGATKRVCEMVIQSRHSSKTSFAAVRFGNVLGSNGSVIPLFKKQIEAGGPLTITDKRIIRYFMTISEACQLVLQAGVQAERGQLFVLNMGKPVKILDLAENLIKLSGLVPYKDIEIKEVGLRPGEKLYEELLVKTENTVESKYDMIFIEKEIPPTRQEVDEKLAILKAAADEKDFDKAIFGVKEALKTVVPSFKDAEEQNKTVI